MLEILFTNLNIFILISSVFCNTSDISKKNRIFSRRMVEEIDDNTTILPSIIKDIDQDHLVSYMVKNVKDIFGLLDEISDPDPYNFTSVVMLTSRRTKDFELEKLTLNTSDKLSENSAKTELLHQPKDLIILGKAEENYGNGINETLTIDKESQIKSCIFCDNVASVQCNDPKNKLISSTICDHIDDLCYSMHTPFGVIERGCYNANHNLTTYVCSCNLCNHISIADLPVIFSRKRDWVDNVVELSRTKRFRKSIFKEMSCVRCEVNVTTKRRDSLKSANCFDGKVAILPTQECEENEICGIKAIKSEGYIWRGCIKRPLYNYWWKFCDSDLCNYDGLTSLYDP